MRNPVVASITALVLLFPRGRGTQQAPGQLEAWRQLVEGIGLSPQ